MKDLTHFSGSSESEVWPKPDHEGLKKFMEDKRHKWLFEKVGWK